MAKQLPTNYIQTNPPVQFEDWPRWIDDELNRIRIALEANPVVLGINGSGTIPIDTTIQTVTLGIGDEPDIDYPGGAWNSTLAEWTCPLDGIYQVNCGAFIEAFGNGNKSYFARLNLYQNDVEVRQQSDGGLDDVPLGVNMAVPILLLQGDVLRMDLSALHEQFTGSSTYDFSLSYLRVATPT